MIRFIQRFSPAFFVIALWSLDCQAAAIKSFSLINADTSRPLAGFDPIVNGSVIDLAALPTKNLNLRANADLMTKSVVFKFDSSATTLVNKSPFMLCVQKPCPKWSNGIHTLSAQPFAKGNAGGKAGVISKLTFTLTKAAPPTPPPTPPPSTCASSRGLWLWTTKDVLASPAEQDNLIYESQQAKVSDIYLYLTARDYVDLQASLQSLIKKLSYAGIKAWGLEGYRGYFSDADGPAGFYAAIDALIAYNGRVAVSEKFVGFQGDLEPQDGQGDEFPSSFHNGKADAALNADEGGVWQASERLDRDKLMQDWLQIYSTARQKLHGAGLRLAAAMPSWTDDYYGEEVHVTLDGSRQSIMKQMMALIDDYMVMSYNTNPANASNRVLAEVTYADSLPANARPRVTASVETHEGVGAGISYADTPGKATRKAVMADINTIKSILIGHPGFCGVNIHDWQGWKQLAP